MANHFSFRRNDPPEDHISISDTGTNVLFHVLLLAGSELAETDSQKRLIVWLAEHDRKIGSGNVGFCLADMPFAAESFDEDRQFMVRTVDAASQRTGWEKLNYMPNEPHLRPMLGWFRRCFARMKPEDIDPAVLENWLSEMDEDDPVLNGFPCCKRHGVLRSWIGCLICNS